MSDSTQGLLGSFLWHDVPDVRIERVQVKGLFGQYSYDINNLKRCAILYGENGVGKTNILTLLYHLLSPAPDASHRTALGKIKFQSAEVFLSNDVMVGAYRENPIHEAEIRTVVVKGGTVVGGKNWGRSSDPNWLAAATALDINEHQSSKQKRRFLENALILQLERESNPNESEEAFLKALRENVPPIYLLAADRILRSDAVENKRGDISTHRISAEDMVEQGRQRALGEAINLASHALYQIGIEATLHGRRSMHSIYGDLLVEIASNKATAESTASALRSTVAGLRYLSDKYELYSRYGLTEPINGEELVKLLEGAAYANQESALVVLTPYINSLKEQAHIFDAAFSAIDGVIGTLNDFLFDKIATFTMSDGIRFENRLGENLDPSSLSSGEQQLLLLFCHIVLATNHNGIFIIDEPEISLNIKWQRKLVDALIQLDSKSKLQFIMASHSMEILTKHRESVIALESSRI